MTGKRHYSAHQKGPKDKFYIKLYESLIRHKVVIASIILISLFFPLEICSIKIDARSRIWANVLAAIAAQCLGVGILSLVWEFFIEKSWLEVIRSYIEKALTDPEVSKHLKSDWQIGMLEQLLLSKVGTKIGSSVYEEIENGSFNEDKMRENFEYNIALKDKNDNFYDAQFYIKFTVSKPGKNLSVRFTKLNNSLEIHNYYQSLIDSNPDIYRYILLSGHEELPKNSFEIMECYVESDGSKVILKPVYPPDLLSESIKLVVAQERDKRRFAKICKNEKCEISIKISTIVDKQYNYFPIMFGYPVYKFSTRLDANCQNIEHVDILEFFTSSGSFSRNKGISDGFVAAAGELKGILLPDSGLVYVWK